MTSGTNYYISIHLHIFIDYRPCTNQNVSLGGAFYSTGHRNSYFSLQDVVMSLAIGIQTAYIAPVVIYSSGKKRCLDFYQMGKNLFAEVIELFRGI